MEFRGDGQPLEISGKEVKLKLHLHNLKFLIKAPRSDLDLVVNILAVYNI